MSRVLVQNRFQVGVRLPIADSLFGLTTYYSRLTCSVAGTQTKLLVSRSPLRSHAKPSDALPLTAMACITRVDPRVWFFEATPLSCCTILLPVELLLPILAHSRSDGWEEVPFDPL